MADALLAGGFWLPPKLFTDDDDDEPQHLKQSHLSPNFTSNFDFPANSGSDGSSLSSPAFSSPVESVLGSTETESDEDDESLAELTRSFTRFGLQATQRSWPLSTSPQSTLSGAEIWGRRKSSPAVVGRGCSWDLLRAEVEGQVARMKMNGGDDGALKGRGGHVGLPMGPTHGQHWLPPTGSFYGQQVPFNHFESDGQDQFLNQNNICSILGRPSLDEVLLHRKIQLQQHMISLHRSNVLLQIPFEENAKCVHSAMSLPQYGGPSLLLQNQIYQMRGASLARFAPKQTCAGTGVFIPRLNPSSAPNKLVAGRSTTHHAPEVFQAMNKNFSQTSTRAFTIPNHDTLTVRSKTIPIQKAPSFQLDGLAKHGQCLPQEWSY